MRLRGRPAGGRSTRGKDMRTQALVVRLLQHLQGRCDVWSPRRDTCILPRRGADRVQLSGTARVQTRSHILAQPASHDNPPRVAAFRLCTPSSMCLWWGCVAASKQAPRRRDFTTPKQVNQQTSHVTSHAHGLTSHHGPPSSLVASLCSCWAKGLNHPRPSRPTWMLHSDRRLGCETRHRQVHHSRVRSRS